MPTYRDTFEDFNLKWQNTYALYKNQAVFVQGAEPISEEGNDFEVSVVLNAQKIIIKDLNNLEPLLFNSQYFNGVDWNLNDSLKTKLTSGMLLSRNPRRQNKRSICGENTIITSPIYPIIEKYHFSIIAWPPCYTLNLSMIQQLQKCQFPTYMEALQACHKQISIALSPNFAISLSPMSSDRFLLSSLFGFIGEATYNEFLIYHQGSLQEVNDFVRRENIPVIVKEVSYAT